MSTHFLPYNRCWAKTDQSPGSEAPVQGIHLVLYHNMDVAGCVYVMLQREDEWGRQLCEALGVSRHVLMHDMALLYMFHDLGKLTDNFQAKSAQAVAYLNSLEPFEPKPILEIPGAEMRHDLVGYTMLRKVQGFLGVGKREINALLHASFSHHGYALPFQKKTGIDPNNRPKASEQWADVENGVKVRNTQERFEAHCEAIKLAMGGLQGDYTKAPDMERASWLLAGIGQISDWLGSTQDYFTLHGDWMDPRTYWHCYALSGATRAYEDVQFAHVPVRETEFWEGLLAPEHSPRPLQRAAQGMARQIEGEGFILIEDATGAGKTEAGLALAREMMHKSGCKGITFALPTRATANGIFPRVMEYAEVSFTEPPTLSLIHSSRQENRTWRILKDSQGGTLTASEWLNSSSRQALFSQVNVCTIDQLLLAVIPRYFAPMRLAALSRSVLVLDEVHTMDAHMMPLLCALLQWCGRAGQPVIAMSATCDAEARSMLIDAYTSGRAKADTPPTLPAMTYVQGDAIRQVQSVNPHQKRELHWEIFEDQGSLDAVVNELVQRAYDGEAVVWFRNTVNSACRAYEAIKARYDDVILTHSRYTLADRQKRDEILVTSFGRGAPKDARRGKIVVCTQVLQESLDVSFDWGISDVCDVDLLIQRAGRVLRHEDGERINVCMGLFTPPLIGTPDARWVEHSPSLQDTRYIYPDIATLYTSASLCKDPWQLPCDTRELLRRAKDEIPKSLAHVHERVLLRDEDTGNTARRGTLDFSKTYAKSAALWGSEKPIQTRDIIPSRRWEVWYEENGVLVPVAGTRSGSRITIPIYWAYDRPEIPEAILDSFPFKQTREVVIATKTSYGWDLPMVDEQGGAIMLSYDAYLGLQKP